MTYHYIPGTVRWSRHNGKGDVRLCTPPKGWERMAYQLERHPTTDKVFRDVQWWFKDRYVGEIA